MTEPIDPLIEALDHQAIVRLQSLYGDVVTRQAWHELHDLFLDDCVVRLDLRGGTVIEMTGPDELGRFIAGSIGQFEFFAFTIRNTVVQVSNDGTATARCYIEELRNGAADHRWTTAFGLYRDQYRKVDGHWRFARRDYSSLARHGADGQREVFDIPS